MSSKCYKHPHQLVVGICASCLREQLAIFANLEREEDQGDREGNHGDHADATHHGDQQASCMESLSLHVSACEDISNGIDADCDTIHVSAREDISKRIDADCNVPCLHSLDSTRGTDGDDGSRACPIESTQEVDSCVHQPSSAAHVLNLIKEEEGRCTSPHCSNLTREQQMPVALASLDFDTPIKEHNGDSSSSNAKIHVCSSSRLNLTSNYVTCTGSSQPPLNLIEEQESSVGSAPHEIYLMEGRYQVVNCSHSSVASQNLTAGCNPTTQQSVDELDFRRSHLECPFMVRRSLSFHEDAKMRLDAGKNTWSGDNRKKKKKTLSYLFNLDKAESGAQCLQDNTNQDFVVQSPLSVSSTATTLTSTFTGKKWGSSSKRSKKNSLFDTGHNTTPLSWFASLFRRHTKEGRPRCLRQKSVSLDCHALEDGKLSWEAPRASAWEQLSFSSAWEGPRSSWQGVTAASDADSVRSCFHYFQDSLSEARQDVDLELDLELEGYDFAINAGNCEHSKRRNAKRYIAPQALSGMQTSDEKMFVMPKALQLQRDVSTQTTPPRAFQSDIDGDVMKQQERPPKCEDNLHQVPFWSKAWIRTLTNSIKQKKITTSAEYQGIAMDDINEQASTISADSSAREDSSNFSQNNRSGAPCGQSQHSGRNINSGYRAWDAYYNSGSQKGFSNVKGSQPLKGFASRRKNGGSNRNRSSSLSPLSSDNGLLRFYLTPVRSMSGTRCRMKPKNPG